MNHRAFAWKIMRPVFQVIWRESKIIHNLVLLWVSMHTQSLIRVQLCDPMDYSTPSSSVHGIFQVRILVWHAISFSRGSPQPKVQTHVSYISCIGRQILYHWTTRNALSSPQLLKHVIRSLLLTFVFKCLNKIVHHQSICRIFALTEMSPIRSSSKKVGRQISSVWFSFSNTL